ncbi:MAG: hypothetical protein WCB00_24295 [Candidatus Acidiferrales bacterium]
MSPIKMDDLYGDQGKLVSPAVVGKPETPVDLSDLYEEHGGLVAHPAENEPSQPEQTRQP